MKKPTLMRYSIVWWLHTNAGGINSPLFTTEDMDITADNSCTPAESSVPQPNQTYPLNLHVHKDHIRLILHDFHAEFSTHRRLQKSHLHRVWSRVSNLIPYLLVLYCTVFTLLADYLYCEKTTKSRTSMNELRAIRSLQIRSRDKTIGFHICWFCSGQVGWLVNFLSSCRFLGTRLGFDFLRGHESSHVSMPQPRVDWLRHWLWMFTMTWLLLNSTKVTIMSLWLKMNVSGYHKIS